jgi:hypothetical protein
MNGVPWPDTALFLAASRIHANEDPGMSLLFLAALNVMREFY